MRDTRPPSGASGVQRGRFSIGGAAFLDRTWNSLGGAEPQGIFPTPERDIGKKLDDVIAGEILPRLMLLHRQKAARANGAATAPDANMPSQVADFADLVIRHETSVAEAYVQFLLQRGLDLETLLLHVLVPAGRRLGELWEADKIDFVDVTIGTSRLQQLIHHLTFPLRTIADNPNRHLLLVPAPGEQHTFGLVMASGLFRREGWQVHGGANGGR
jgi:hypothetical protein